MSATDGACGRVEGRGILFDRDAPCETKLESFVARESMFAVERERLERVALTGRTEWMFALGRLEKAVRRAEYRVSDVTRREGEDNEN